MVLTLSISSFTMTVGFYQAGGDSEIFKVSIHKRMTADDFYFHLTHLAGLGALQGPIEGAIVASVAPRLTGLAAQAAERLCGVRPYIIGPGIKTGIDIKINDPGQLGADLVAMAAGVAAKYPLPALLLNISEATTISYIDGKSRYLGTVIYSGLGPMMQSLVESAELLNPVSLGSPGKVLGTSTEESIRSGLIYGTAGMLDSVTDRIMAGHPAATIVATGGDSARAVLPYCRPGIIYDESLLCDGMYHIFMRQKPGKRE